MMVMSMGRKERSERLLEKINEKGEKFVYHVKRADVLEHAK